MSEITRTCKKGFEITTCGRCGGSGHYSYCERYGTRCFKCHGSGVVYTKRGLAALAFWKAARTVRADSVTVGQFVRLDRLSMSGDSSTAAWWTVTGVEHYTQTGASLKDGVMVPYALPYVRISARNKKLGENGICCPQDADVVAYHGKEGEETLLEAARAYQAGLLDNGKERKRAR